MRAIVCVKYGPPDVLEMRDVAKPVPRADEVLIRIKATTCHIADVRVRGADVPWTLQLPFRLYMGLSKPRQPILGMELAGIVEGAGSAVHRFDVGDAVLATSPFRLGAYAEYICLPDNAPNIRRGLVARKPRNMSFEEAAAGLATGGMTALCMLRKASIERGQKVLVYGASGSVGMYALQLAKCFGANVTAVCSSRNTDLVRSLGADTAIDYTRPDFASWRETFDVVLDAVGMLSRADAIRLSGTQGRRFSVARDTNSVARMTATDLEYLTELVEAGKIRTFIDRQYALERIRDAHVYVGQRHKRGHVVVTVDPHGTDRSPAMGG